MKTAFLDTNPKNIERVYPENVTRILREELGCDGVCYTKEMLLENPEKFRDTEFVFSTWGMLTLTKEEIHELLPALRCVFYAAGTVQYFARPFLESGIRVYSAWAANAVPVAEYVTAQIILANKGFFRTAKTASDGNYPEAKTQLAAYAGNYGNKVGLIGAGMIGKLVIEMLRAYRLEVMVFDPFLPDEKAAELGVEKVSLEKLFADCSVVSNHLANNEQTKGMLNGALFETMRPFSTFLNTGRGAQVVESDLADFLARRPDVMAVLDVTDPEPPVEGSPFYTLENCILTPHIAGSNGDEVHRMAEYMLEEYRSYCKGEKGRYEVSLKMLETMA